MIYNIDITSITERLRNILEIRNKDEMSVSLTNAHAIEIKEYLKLLDLIYEIPVINTAFPDKKKARTIITQPGLRYSQSDALIESLMQDSMMDNISISEKTYIESRIRNEIKGRMTEEYSHFNLQSVSLIWSSSILKIFHVKSLR